MRHANDVLKASLLVDALIALVVLQMVSALFLFFFSFFVHVYEFILFELKISAISN
jgi:hypothetical protein